MPPAESVSDSGIPLFTQMETAGIPAVTQPEKVEIPTVSVPASVENYADLHSSPSSPLKALLDQMEKAFPVPSIKPDSDMASLQYAAGQRAVVDWVRMKQKRGQA